MLRLLHPRLWALAVLGVGAVAAYLIVSLDHVHDSTDVNIRIGELRAHAEEMVAAATLPTALGGGPLALRGHAAELRAAIQDAEPDIRAVLGDEVAARSTADLMLNADRLFAALDKAFTEGFEPTGEAATVFFGLSSQIGTLSRLLDQELADETATLQRTVTVGLVALAVAGSVGAVATGWATRRAATLRRREQEVEARYRAAEREKRQFESFANSVAAGLVMVDQQGTITYCNNRAGELLGVDAVDLASRPIGVLANMLRAGALDAAAFDGAWEELSSPSESWPTVELKMSLPRAHVLRWAAFPVLDSEAGRLGEGYLLLDVTTEREVERMKTNFIGLASHELRTPLTGVVGFSELLATQVSDPQQKEWAQRIQTEARELTGLVDEILDVSQIDADAVKVNQEALDFDTVLSAALVSTSQFATVGHPVAVSGEGRHAIVLADRAMLAQALHNVVENSLRYSPPGGTVQIRCHTDGDRLRVDVVDQGQGIPAERLGEIFGRFQRVERPDASRLRGSGLGLYIARRLVTRMGGDISVTSQPGEGSTFTFSIPLAPAGATTAAVDGGHSAFADSRARGGAGGPGTGTQGGCTT